MSKHKHKSHKRKKTFRPSTSGVANELMRIEDIIEKGNLLTAMDKLRQLSLKAPHNVEIIESLFEVAVQMNDPEETLLSAIRLTELQPNIPAHYFNLYNAYRQNFFPALALHTVQYFCARWNNLELTDKLKDEAENLENRLRKIAFNMGLAENSWLDHLVLHEQVRVALLRNHYQNSQSLATKLIAMAPDFVPAYNNRSLAYYLNNQIEEAIADARQALKLDPKNIHALSNLTRFLRISNRIDEAREIAEQLWHAGAADSETWTKKVEAFSYLADDAAVLEVSLEAKKGGVFEDIHSDALIFHLAGMAAARLGDKSQASHFWREALKRAPSFSIVKENLEDVNKPAGEQNGPWPFTFSDWMPLSVAEDFIHGTGGSKRKFNVPENERQAEKFVRSFIQRHPQVMSLLPVLLERGDSLGREFAIQVAKLAQTPESFAMLKEFMQSPNGTDKQRFNVIQILVQNGIIFNGQPIQFWSGGQQTKIVPQDYKIDSIPYEVLSPKAIELRKSGIEALRQEDSDRAVRYLTQALEEAPHSASIAYNLAAVEIERGNISNARAQLQALSIRHPKYIFALTQLALVEMANDRLEEARELLTRASTLQHFHYDEFAAYCKAQIFLALLSDGTRNAAKGWLDMWKKTSPDDPNLDAIQSLVDKSVLGRVLLMRQLSPLRE